MTVCSQGRCQNTPMYTSESLSSTCPIANQMPGTRGRKAGVVWLAVFGRPQMVCGWCPIVDGRQCMLAKMMNSVNMVILTLLSVWPPGQDLKLSQGYGVENRGLICSRKDKQLDFTESRSHTQFSHRDVRWDTHHLWAYVCTFSLVQMATMVMTIVTLLVMMYMMLMVMQPKALSQVVWVLQHQHQCFHTLSVNYWPQLIHWIL